MYISQEVAERIKSTLKSRNKSTKSMLADLNMGINTISELSKGKQLSYLSFAKIADYLDCSVDYLLGRADSPASFYGDGFTAHDKALIDAYKKQPDVRLAVDKLLGLNGKPAYDFSGMDLSGAAIAAFGGTTSADDSADYSAISELLSNKDKEL